MDFIVLSILAGFFQALNIQLDSYNLSNLGLGLYNYIFYALLTNFLLSLMLIFFRKKIDNTQFKIKKIKLRYLLLSGLFGSAYTIYYLRSLNVYGAEMIAPIAPFYLVYLIFLDKFLLKTRLNLRSILFLTLISLGGFLVNFKGLQEGLLKFVFVMVSLNLLCAGYAYFSKVSLKEKANVVILRIVNSGMMFFLYFLFFYKRLDLGFSLVSYGHIFVSISFVVVSNVLYTVALKKGSVSKVNGLKLSNIVFVILIAFIFGHLGLETFAAFKILGLVFVASGVLGISQILDIAKIKVKSKIGFDYNKI